MHLRFLFIFYQFVASILEFIFYCKLFFLKINISEKLLKFIYLIEFSEYFRIPFAVLF